MKLVRPVPEIAVIICHHTGTLIEKCLDSVMASVGVQLEVWVISSQKAFTIPWAAVKVAYSTEGPAQKRNLGVVLTHSRAPYYVFLDDDVEVSPHCLGAFLTEMRLRPQCGVGWAKIYNMERRDEFDDCGSWLTWTGFLWARAQETSESPQEDYGQYDTPLRCLASKSATCIMRREAFQAARGFDPAYFILGEETDLSWRMQLLGWESWYLPSAVSWHAFNTSMKPLADYYTLERIHTRGCANYLSLLTTNLGLLRLTLIFPWHLLGWSVALVGYGLLGRWPASRAIWRGAWLYLTHLPAILRKRRRVQQARNVSDRALFRVAWYTPPLTYYVQRLVRYLLGGVHG